MFEVVYLFLTSFNHFCKTFLLLKTLKNVFERICFRSFLQIRLNRRYWRVWLDWYFFVFLVLESNRLKLILKNYEKMGFSVFNCKMSLLEDTYKNFFFLIVFEYCFFQKLPDLLLPDSFNCRQIYSCTSVFSSSEWDFVQNFTAGFLKYLNLLHH